jgi:amino acid transporter
MLGWLVGRPLANREQEEQRIGPAAGVAVLGLDALGSASYGPEAALTMLIPLGAAGLGYSLPIIAVICAILAIVYFSYRQTIAAYPDGGSSYRVARDNLGTRFGLIAGAALATDYILNVAVAISAGVGALVSAVPSLLPHTLGLTLGILALITLVNLRGIKQAGRALMTPTYVFVATLGLVVVVGVVKTIVSGGSPEPVERPPAMAPAAEAASLWLLLRAFANGCTAMTGVEAVSNAVPIFRKPATQNAQRTLTVIIAILLTLLIGNGVLAYSYHIGATRPGEPGYQSLLSMLVAAVLGRGPLYYVTMAAIIAVLTLSANTSFADFPRLCRLLGEDGYLPQQFAERGRRLVYSIGIVVLAVLSGVLLLAFGGITDRLIPLFAIGALLAFTMSQAGMVAHWKKTAGRRSRHFMAINALGAGATGATVAVVAVSKFTEGAWITVIIIPLLVLLFHRVHRHYGWIARQVETIEPMELPERLPPVVVLAAETWDRMTQHALKLALRLSDDIYVVQVKTETSTTEDLSDNWELLIANPARRNRVAQPKLVILTSEYREFLSPFVDFVSKLEDEHPDRDITVIVPDLVLPDWYAELMHNHRGRFLRMALRSLCTDRVAVISAPFHLTRDQ